MDEQAQHHAGREVSAPQPDRAFRRESLVRRLEDGYIRIDHLAMSGGDVREWESFWIKLLREYEGVCRELDSAA
jgi:hypothetical protein